MPEVLTEQSATYKKQENFIHWKHLKNYSRKLVSIFSEYYPGQTTRMQ